MTDEWRRAVTENLNALHSGFQQVNGMLTSLHEGQVASIEGQRAVKEALIGLIDQCKSNSARNLALTTAVAVILKTIAEESDDPPRKLMEMTTLAEGKLHQLVAEDDLPELGSELVKAMNIIVTTAEEML